MLSADSKTASTLLPQVSRWRSFLWQAFSQKMILPFSNNANMRMDAPCWLQHRWRQKACAHIEACIKNKATNKQKKTHIILHKQQDTHYPMDEVRTHSHTQHLCLISEWSHLWRSPKTPRRVHNVAFIRKQRRGRFNEKHFGDQIIEPAPRGGWWMDVWRRERQRQHAMFSLKRRKTLHSKCLKSPRCKIQWGGSWSCRNEAGLMKSSSVLNAAHQSAALFMTICSF